LSSSAGAWSPLRGAALLACAIDVAREEIAYFKYLFESYEGVAIVRTVETHPGGRTVIAILATEDFVAEADAILLDVARVGAPQFVATALPPVCTEDWFLETWARDESALPGE
jgi:uncharacterized protein DUF4911